jgi:hypothetical protein
MKAKSTFIVLLVSTVLLFAYSCSDTVATEEIPDIPEFPSFSEASVAGPYQTFTETRTQHQDDDTHFSNVLDKMQDVFMMFIQAASVPVYMFELTAESEPDFENNTFTWAVDAGSDELISSSFITTASINDDGSVEWVIYSEIAGMVPGSGLQQIEFLRGTDNRDHSSGDWEVQIFRELGFSGDLPDPSERFENLFDLFRPFSFNWDVRGVDDKTLTIEREGGSNPFFASFSQNGAEFSFELLSDEGSLFTIFWDSESGEGFYDLNGERSCWDSSFQDTVCNG